MKKSLIVAVADNHAIGKDNALLWHLSEDLKYFKKTTMGCPVIMGRKTFESIGRPLPKRLNIVVTRSGCAPGGSVLQQWLEEAPERIVLAHSLEEAWETAASWLQGRAGTLPEDEVREEAFVIGGGEIYRQALMQVERLYVTHVHTVIPEADTFFPEIDASVWQKEKVSETFTDPETSYTFEFVIYSR